MVMAGLLQQVRAGRCPGLIGLRRYPAQPLRGAFAGVGSSEWFTRLITVCRPFVSRHNLGWPGVVIMAQNMGMSAGPDLDILAWRPVVKFAS
jgi:hypothetical protein